jgi:hypothetical protein
MSGQPVVNQDCINQMSNLGNSSLINSHLWWKDIYINTPYKLHYSACIENKNVIEDFSRLYGVSKYQVSDYPQFDLSFVRKFNYSTWGDMGIKYYRLFTPIIIYGLLCQIFAVMKACEYCYEDDTDIIVKSRPDISHTQNILNVLQTKSIRKDTIYFQGSMDGGHKFCGEHPNKPCDWFFLGHKNAMLKFCQNWYSAICNLYADGIIHANESIQKVCALSNLNFEMIDFGAYVHKQISNWHYEKLIPYTTYIDSFDFENCIVTNDAMWPHWYKKVDFAHFKNME